MSKTVFPGIEVTNIATEEAFRGAEEQGQFFPNEPISDFVEDVVGDRDKIVYDLSVNAFTEAGAIAKARAYVRAKNPFEFDRLDVIDARMVDDELVNTYTVMVGVTKN